MLGRKRPEPKLFRVIAAPTQIYYWPREFILRSHDFEQHRPYRRVATSLVIASQGELEIETEDRGLQNCAAILLGPNTRRLRLRLQADNFASAAWIFDFAPATPVCRGLGRKLKQQPSQLIVGDELLALRQGLQRLTPELLSWQQARALHHEIGATLLSQHHCASLEPRVAQVLALLDDTDLDELSIAALAKQVGLSESRLRSLVRRELSCNLAQYARWAAAWRTVLHWYPGMNMTDAAHAAGFHDLAHANHAANDMFGMSPSRFLNSDQVLMVNCGQDISGA